MGAELDELTKKMISPGALFALVKEDSALAHASPVALSAALATHFKEGDFFFPGGENEFVGFLKRVATLDDKSFRACWHDVGELIANSVSLASLLRGAMIALGPSAPMLPVKLESYLRSALVEPEPLGLGGTRVGEDVKNLGVFAAQSFERALAQADVFFSFKFRLYALGYGIRYAARILLRLDPAKALALPGTAREPPQVILLGTMLNDIGAASDRGRLLEPLLRAELPLLRAIGVAGVWDLSVPVAERLNMLGLLAANENVAAAAQWVREMRVDANREPGRDETHREAREAVMKHVVDHWKAGGSESTLKFVLDQCGGPIPGCWAFSTMSELVAPLEAAHPEITPTVDEYWLSLFLRRLEPHFPAGGSKGRYFDSSDGQMATVAATRLHRCGEARTVAMLAGIRSNSPDDLDKIDLEPLMHALNGFLYLQLFLLELRHALGNDASTGLRDAVQTDLFRAKERAQTAEALLRPKLQVKRELYVAAGLDERIKDAAAPRL